MKYKFPTRVYPIVLTTIVALTSGAIAADSNPDPFRNDKPAGSASRLPAAKTSKEPSGSTVSIREETFSMNIKDAHAVMSEFKTDEEKYERVVKMMSEEKAFLERLMVLRANSGQRVESHSVIQLRYGTEWDLASHEADRQKKEIWVDALVATGFETRDVGDTTEFEPVASADGKTIGLNITPRRVNFIRETETGGPYSAKSPLFEDQRVTTSVTVQADRPFLLCTLNPAFNHEMAQGKAGERRIWLHFLICSTLDMEGASRP